VAGTHRSREKVDRIGEQFFDMTHAPVANHPNVEVREKTAANSEKYFENEEREQAKNVGYEVASREEQCAESENVAGAVWKAGLVDHCLKTFGDFKAMRAELLLPQQRARARAGRDTKAAQAIADPLAGPPLGTPDGDFGGGGRGEREDEDG